MSIDSKHPKYTKLFPEWVQMRDLYEGSRKVKEKGQVYLPATCGMRMDGMQPGQDGYKAYEAYKLRAYFPDSVKECVEILIGLLHQKPANITLPAAMESLRERATSEGESLQNLLRRINEEQLVTGRVGLLADLPVNPDPVNPTPYISFYAAETVINWDDGDFEINGFSNLNLVVLDESGYQREDIFNWVEKNKYRVLVLGDPLADESGPASYRYGVFEDDSSFNEAELRAPSLRGVELDQIPFAFINSKDAISEPDLPPLIGLGELVLCIYRGEADYRQNLFMQGQDTLVIQGQLMDPELGMPSEDQKDKPLRTGAGARIELSEGGDAKYIGVSGAGLPEQRMALETDYKRAETRTGRLINSRTGGNRESGEALKTRLAAQTATLNDIALAGAAGLQHILRIIAKWMGLNPEEVIVKPNLEFADFSLSGQDILSIMQAKQLGFPISQESMHKLAVERGMTEMDFGTEMKLIMSEKPIQSENVDVNTRMSGNPGDNTNAP